MADTGELMTAIGKRDAAAVRAILRSDPGLANQRPAAGPSPLLMAAYVRDRDIADILRPHVTMDACEAAALGEVAILRALLDREPPLVNARSGDGWTPLHLAGFFGHGPAAELLLSRGADVAAISGGQERNTPLHAALAGADDHGVVMALLALGADPNAVAANGYRPIHVAASRGDDEMVRLLIEHGADPRAAMGDGKTAADIASDRGHEGTAALLRRYTS